MSCGARHRAATKPMPLTSRNSTVKMMISVMWSLDGDDDNASLTKAVNLGLIS